MNEQFSILNINSVGLLLTSAGFNGLLPGSLSYQVVLVEPGSIGGHVHRVGGVCGPDVSYLRLGVGVYNHHNRRELNDSEYGESLINQML